MTKLSWTTLLLALASSAIAENKCPYCGDCSPYGDTAKEVRTLTVSSHELILPNCKPLSIELSEYSNEASGYIPPEGATISPATAIYLSKTPLNCAHEFGQPKGDNSKIKFVLRPRTVENGEVLLVEISPSLGGQPFLQFGAMRSGHNPCDEGTHFGFHICSLRP